MDINYQAAVERRTSLSHSYSFMANGRGITENNARLFFATSVPTDSRICSNAMLPLLITTEFFDKLSFIYKRSHFFYNKPAFELTSIVLLRNNLCSFCCFSLIKIFIFSFYCVAIERTVTLKS